MMNISKGLSTVAAAAVLVVGGAALGPQTAAWAADQLNGDQVADNTLDGGEIQNESVTGSDIDNGTLTGLDIRNQTLGTNDYAPGSVTDVSVQNGSLRGVDVENGTLTGVDVADGTVEWQDLAPGVGDSIVENLSNGGALTAGKWSTTWTHNVDGTESGQLVISGTQLVTMSVRSDAAEPSLVVLTDHLGAEVMRCVVVPVAEYGGTCTAAGVLASGSSLVITGPAVAVRIDGVTVK